MEKDVLNRRALIQMKQKMITLKEKMGKYTIRVGAINTSLSVINRTREKISKEWGFSTLALLIFWAR